MACVALETLVITGLEKGYCSETITVCPYPVPIGISPDMGPNSAATVLCIALYSEKIILDPRLAISNPYSMIASTNLTSVFSLVSNAIANISAC